MIVIYNGDLNEHGRRFATLHAQNEKDSVELALLMLNRIDRELYYLSTIPNDEYDARNQSVSDARWLISNWQAGSLGSLGVVLDDHDNVLYGEYERFEEVTDEDDDY